MTNNTITPDLVRARHEVFLRQTIAHNVGIVKAPRGAAGAHADAAVNAWWAHRLLAALADAVPERLPALLASISEELESGEAHEAAWEDAKALGIDADALSAHMESKFGAGAS